MKNNTLKKLLSVLLALAMLLTSFGAAALAEGETPDPSLYKTFIVELTDSYGDGWNGNALIVRQRDAEEAAYTFTFDDGSAATFEMTLTAGEAYDLIWQEGSYADEASFTVIEQETGAAVFAVSGCDVFYDGQTIFSFTPHAHTWEYDVTMGYGPDDNFEAFLRAYCTDDCYIIEQPDLRVCGPDNGVDFVYDGTAKPAVLWTSLHPELFPETGYSTDAFPGAEVSYTKNEEAFEGLPVEQGHYLARATVDGMSAAWEYAIHKWTSNGDGTHSINCEVCGRNETAACDFALTATENGVKKFTCPLCGGAKYETFSTQTVTWDFEGDPAGSWTFVDADNDGNNWVWSGSSDVVRYYGNAVDVEYLGRDESRCIMSGSFSNVYGVLRPDNWAVSPAVSTEGAASAAVSFYACAQDLSYPSEHFRVYAAHSSDIESLAASPISDEEVLTATRSQGSWLRYTYEIPSELLNGEPIYFAIRHFNVSDQFLIDIDDVTYTANMQICDPHTPVLVEPDAVSCHAPYYRCADCGRPFRDAGCESPVLLSEISFADGHALTASADGGTLNVSCANGVCGLNAALTLNAPAKAADYNAGSALASLTGLEAFNAALGLSVSADDIVYYSGDTLLAAAPTAMGDYTAALTVTVGGADYTIRVAYFIGDPAALAVMAAIDAIGEVAYTDACKDKIDAARNAYNALTDAQKALVANYVVLTDAEDMYATLKGLHDWDAANNVVQLIDDIGEVAYTQECFAKINLARYYYDSLTEDQKALVSNYGVLIDAEAAFAALALAADKAAFDAYKFNLVAAVQAMAQDGDSEAAAQIIADAAAAIALLDYDTAKTLDENKAAVDALADIAEALAAQRAADKAAFEAYKAEKKTAVEAMAEEGDSTDAQQIIADAAAAIETLTYDEAKTLDENKAAVDALANIADRLAAQRATDLYAAKIEFDHYKTEQKAAVEAMAQEGDSEAVAQIIAEAAAAIDALIYDEFYTLAENKATVDTLANIADRLAAQRAADAAAAQLAADKAAFDAYKFNLVAAVQAMAQDGDSEAAAQIIADAASDLALLAYDETKSLAENEAALDALADIADALAAQRAADAAAAADRAAAAAVDALIDAIGEVEYTDACKEKIDAARAAYEALTPAQQALVEKYETLTAAEDEYARLKAEAEQPGEEESATPAEGARVCQLCGETHDVTKPVGYIIDYIHEVIFFIMRLVRIFTFELYFG